MTTRANEFFNANVTNRTGKTEIVTSQLKMRFGLRMITLHGVDTLINNYENKAAARRSMMAAVESNLAHYRKCTFELFRIADDVVLDTAKHKSLLK